MSRKKSAVLALGVLVLALFPRIAETAEPDDPHLKLNPLYRELREKGVALGTKVHQAFPAPTMADGLDAKAQKKVLGELAGDDYPLEELTRSSVVAPHIFKFRDIPTQDAANLGRGTDLWFIAYGKLESLTHANLVALYQGSAKDKQLTPLKDKDLVARNLQLQKQADAEETYFHTTYTILERVKVEAAFRTVTSRTKDSVVLASRLDPTFNKDKEYPNRWKPMTADEAGNLVVGAARPYEGAGVYLKVTRLQEPEGTLFVEFHQIFAEPKKWFTSPNVLRSKLPLLVQSEVRAFRRELAKLRP